MLVGKRSQRRSIEAVRWRVLRRGVAPLRAGATWWSEFPQSTQRFPKCPTCPELMQLVPHTLPCLFEGAAGSLVRFYRRQPPDNTAHASSVWPVKGCAQGHELHSGWFLGALCASKNHKPLIHQNHPCAVGKAGVNESNVKPVSLWVYLIICWNWWISSCTTLPCALVHERHGASSALTPESQPTTCRLPKWWGLCYHLDHISAASPPWQQLSLLLHGAVNMHVWLHISRWLPEEPNVF